MVEANEIIKGLEEKKEMQLYMKKFMKLKKDKSDKLVEELKGLNNIKMNDYHLVKIVDFAPDEKEEISKIFTDVSLTEEETNAILDIVKKY